MPYKTPDLKVLSYRSVFRYYLVMVVMNVGHHIVNLRWMDSAFPSFPMPCCMETSVAVSVINWRTKGRSTVMNSCVCFHMNVPYSMCLHCTLLNVAQYSISIEVSCVLFYSHFHLCFPLFHLFDKSPFSPAVYSAHGDCELSLHTFVFSNV